ncbi:MAG TPA: NAD(P)/FAD-dependent oxidoreductase [Chthoniobacterales bacterium]|nr:NAD(P)/FAD-dependent oxidoreductase [Chthoniobacterales bacterium]
MDVQSVQPKYDVVILGAGHNGLVAASYLGRAGLSVLLLEKNDYIGGATTSQKIFPDYDARLSRYSYLVSLFPEKIIRDLELNLQLRRRPTGSFTPYIKSGRHEGLLISNVDENLSRRSIVDLTGSEREFEQMQKFYNLARLFAQQTWDSMLEPLVSKEEMKKRFDRDDVTREAWRSLVDEPLGLALERYLENDLVRGLVLTDGKIGVFTHPHDPSLVQNRCFLYHLIGNKTGEWKVPVGGMGAVASELERSARDAGAEFLTNVDIGDVDLGQRSVGFDANGKKQNVEARFLLVNFGRNVLAKYSGKPFEAAAEDEGSVFKINMLLRRLPKLKAKKYSAAQAWSGTFHSDEAYEQMNASYEQAAKGRLPDRTPCEVYCHTLTDDSILSPELRAKGFHTITLFGLDAPYALFAKDNERMRESAEKKFLASMNQWLEEPLEDCLAVARDGSRCIESKSPVDIEESLGMYHGNIFQDAPTWPFATNKEQAGKWGVETDWENVFVCGSSALRGGAVSGIPGHNAARAVLDIIQKTLNAQQSEPDRHSTPNVELSRSR